MNKKTVITIILSMIFSHFTAYAMHRRIVCAVQILTGGALVANGFKNSYDLTEDLKEPIPGQPMSDCNQEFIRQRMIRLGLSDAAANIELLYDSTNESSWRSNADKAIMCNQFDNKKLEELLKMKLQAQELSILLKKKHESEKKAYLECQQSHRIASYYKRYTYKAESNRLFSSIKQIGNDIEQISKIDDEISRELAYLLVIITHEIKHYVNQDIRKKGYFYSGIPIAIESVLASLRYTGKKIFNIKAPTKIVPTLLRCSLSGFSVYPRFILYGGFLLVYERYTEVEADRFAYENAQSRLELEEGYNYWKQQEAGWEQEVVSDCNQRIAEGELFDIFILVDPIKREKLMRGTYFNKDPKHPYPADRAKMAQSYLEKWDQEHKE